MKTKNKKIVYILNTHEEYFLLKNKFNNLHKIYIFNNHLNSKILNKKKLFADFYSEYKNYNYFNIKKDYLCKNWFKFYNFVSKDSQINLIGNLLFSRLHSDFTDKLRIFLSLEKISKSNDHVYYSSKLPNKFKEIQKFFYNCKEFKSSKNLHTFLSSTVQRSTYRWSPQIHRYSKIARLAQFLIPKNKTLVFSDPYYEHKFKEREGLIFLNNLNPFKGYYFNKKSKKHHFFKKKNINKDELLKIISSFVKLKKINFHDNLIKIFCNSIIENFYKGLNYFNWSYDIYFELINYYQPIKIVFPNIISFDYLLVNHLAKKYNIKTFVCLDGIEAVFNPLNILFEKNKFIYDKLICYGKADYKLNIRHKISKKQLLLGKLPIKINKDNNIKIFDFIIMSYQPRTYNLESRWDKRYLHAIEIISILNELGYEKIAIKIKPDSKNLNFEINYIKKLIRKNKYSCEILTGNISNYIHQAKNIIGGISTCVWESAYLDIPYYIYEPRDMGLLNYQIKNSILFNDNNVSRNLMTLKKNILRKKFFRQKKQTMFDGYSLDKIHLI